MNTSQRWCVSVFYLQMYADLCTASLFTVVIHFIRMDILVRLCHKDGLFLKNPLPVHFDHLLGC